MKLSNKNNAVNFLLDTDKTKISEWLDPKGNEEMTNFLESFPIMKPLFRKHIYYLCKSFLDSYNYGYAKLKEAMNGLCIDQCGTFIYSLTPGSTATIFYSIKAKCEKETLIENGRVLMFANEKDKPRPSLLFASIIKDCNGVTLINKRLKGSTLDYDNQTFQNILSNVVGLAAFIKYCPIETKMVLAGAKSVHNKTRLFNQTHLPIEILDSTWFTTIVRSEGFTVGKESGGFFRWQPCGPGLSERKLVWIYPFQKHGYVRHAKILKEEAKGVS